MKSYYEMHTTRDDMQFHENRKKQQFLKSYDLQLKFPIHFEFIGFIIFTNSSCNFPTRIYHMSLHI